MVERFQYMLILLLFVLTGNLEEVSFGAKPCEVQSILTPAAESDTFDAVRNQLSVWTHSCDFSMETPVASLDHKLVVRQRTAMRCGVESAFELRIARCTRSDTSPGNAVDHYVFSLERILI